MSKEDYEEALAIESYYGVDTTVVPCSTCLSVTWAAKNDSYCTSCEREWYAIWRMTVSDKPNPKQKMIDKILEEVQNGSS